MSADLSGVRLKLKRAAVHLKAVEDGVRSYLDASAGILHHSADANGNCRITINLEREPDPQWGVVIGDFVHNARSALDHLVWQLVLDNKKRPSTDNFFPVFLTDRKWDTEIAKRDRRRRRKSPLAGVHADHVEMIRLMQPYVVANKPGGAKFTRLAILNAMWNLDKHRFLHAGVLFADAREGNPQVQFDGTAALSDFRIHLPAGPLTHGDLFATFHLGPGARGEISLKVTPKAPLTIVFEGLEIGPIRADQLRQPLTVADSIVDSFAAALE